MAEAKTAIANKPAWVDLSSSDPAGSREFYSKLFGWKVEVNPDPQYGGYALAKLNGKDVAGIGPKQSPEGPSAWAVYIGTPDAEELGKKVQAAGGKVIAPAFDIGPQGRMAVFQDPSGAFISGWQPAQMGGFQIGGAKTYGWAERNAREDEKGLPLYKKEFGGPAGAGPLHFSGRDNASATVLNSSSTMNGFWSAVEPGGMPLTPEGRGDPDMKITRSPGCCALICSASSVPSMFGM